MVAKGLNLSKEEIMINIRAKKDIHVHSVQPPLFTHEKTKIRLKRLLHARIKTNFTCSERNYVMRKVSEKIMPGILDNKKQKKLQWVIFFHFQKRVG